MNTESIMPVSEQHKQTQTVLTNIVHDKQLWLAARKKAQPLAHFKSDITPSDRDFYQALKRPNTVFILECKKASPSKGLIRADFDPVQIAKAYQPYAAAISVLTDEKYFQGSFDFLPMVRQAVTQPVLCKDFIIDAYQIYLARYYQADAILLMLSVLTDAQYQQLSAVAHELGMGVLTEASTEHEVARAVQLQAKVIGINNRNLRDLSVDLTRVKQLAPNIPADVTIISESGIYTHQQVLDLSHHANGFLIGSALMSEHDLTAAIRRVILGDNKVCGLTRPQDAAAAYQAGANYGGLIFVPTSARYITPQQARQVMAAAPLKWVGVFQNASIEHIVHTAKTLELAAVQLHGQEDATYIAQLRAALPAGMAIWRALAVSSTLPALSYAQIDRIVLDNGAGGTGQTFDWRLTAQHNLSNVMIAGGITPENAQAASQLGAAGLDINSGAESAPGIKDAEKLTELFAQLRAYPY